MKPAKRSTVRSLEAEVHALRDEVKRLTAAVERIVPNAPADDDAEPSCYEAGVPKSPWDDNDDDDFDGNALAELCPEPIDPPQ